MNLTRESAVPRELSSIAAGGAFNDAPKFAAVTGIDVDFSDYCFGVGPAFPVIEKGTGPSRAELRIPIWNKTG